MRRTLAVTAALLLLMSLLGPAALAERGGRGRTPANVPPVPIPALGPNQGPDIERVDNRGQNQQPEQSQAQEPAQQQEQGPAQNHDGNAPEPPANGAERRPAPHGGEDDEYDATDDVRGRRPVPPGLVVARNVLGALANGQQSPEDDDSATEASSENGPQLTARLRLGQTDHGDNGEQPKDEAEEDVVDPPMRAVGRLWALRRVLQKRAMPFMMVGQPEIHEGSFVGVDLVRGNRLARDVTSEGAPLTLDDNVRVRLVTIDGVQVCQQTAQECLVEWAALDGAYVQVFGRVVLDAQGDAVMVAYRINVIVRPPACADCPVDKDDNGDTDDDGDVDDDAEDDSDADDDDGDTGKDGEADKDGDTSDDDSDTGKDGDAGKDRDTSDDDCDADKDSDAGKDRDTSDDDSDTGKDGDAGKDRDTSDDDSDTGKDGEAGKDRDTSDDDSDADKDGDTDGDDDDDGDDDGDDDDDDDEDKDADGDGNEV